MKRLGNFLLAILPTLMMIGIQVLGVMIASILITAIVSSQAVSADNYKILSVSQKIFKDQELTIYFIIQILSITFFGAWFIEAKIHNNLTRKNKLKEKSVWLGILSLTIGMYIITALFMFVMEVLVPNQMLEYSQVVQGFQLDDFRILPYLNILVLAPIGEELIFRGITMNYAKKMSNHFWIANFMQAALFGLVHRNLIQGIYAFVLGLVLGYFSYIYQSIYVSMIMHAIYNFFGSVVAKALETVPINFTNITFAIILLAFFLWYGINQVRKTR